MDYSKYACLLVDIQDGIATVTLNRPDQLNTTTGGLHLDLEYVFADLAEDPAVNTIVVTGAGRAFSAGGDIKVAKNRYGTEAGWDYVSGVYAHAKRLVEGIINCPKPTIAAINGDAMGVGATLALCCDMQVIANTARIADTHVKVGLVAGDGGAVIWPLLLGLNKAKEFLMCGKVINGEEAARLGLVNYSVPVEEVLPKAMELARTVSALPALAVKWTKVSMNRMLKEQFNTIMDASIAYEALSMMSKDRGEALDAFLEKRKPKYTGR